jgi:hypothetical protein
MIKLVAWLLGRRPDAPVIDTTAVDQRNAEAEQHRTEARRFRVHAEQVGPEVRAGVQQNHLGERFTAAFYADDRRRQA